MLLSLFLAICNYKSRLPSLFSVPCKSVKRSVPFFCVYPRDYYRVVKLIGSESSTITSHVPNFLLLLLMLMLFSMTSNRVRHTGLHQRHQRQRRHHTITVPTGMEQATTHQRSTDTLVVDRPVWLTTLGRRILSTNITNTRLTVSTCRRLRRRLRPVLPTSKVSYCILSFSVTSSLRWRSKTNWTRRELHLSSPTTYWLN